MKSFYFSILIFLCTQSVLVAQTYLDQWYCEAFCDFEPFEYNEENQEFSINLALNCDEDNEGVFFYDDLNDAALIIDKGSDYKHILTEMPKGSSAHYALGKFPQLGSSLNDPGGVGWFGVELNHDEFKGTLLLILDQALLDSIKTDVDNYIQTLIGDGWKVEVLTTDEDDTVVSVKDQIILINDSIEDLKTIFILGDVPVPYSGEQVGPDGHFEFRGAWMADSYYADLDGEWTDTEATNTNADNLWAHNVPGDGKFDQDEVPSEVELEFGRIYFENLPLFEEAREVLYSRYLNKNIRYRKGGIIAENDFFLHANTAAYPSSMHQALNMLNGSAPHDKKFTQEGNLVVLDHLPFESYQFASINGFGAPGGQWINGRVSSSDFKNDSMQVTFCALSASNIGNWGYDNNLLNSSVASKGNTILSFWGLYALPLHYLYSGQSFGFCLKNHINFSDHFIINWQGFDSPKSVTNTLFGDPSLKYFVHSPAEELLLNTDTENSINLSWIDDNPDENLLGYNVYRSSTLKGNFTKLNSDLIIGIEYLDDSPIEGNNVYSVRAVRLDSSLVSSYFTYSNGIIDSINFEMEIVDLDQDGFSEDIDCNDENPDVNPDQEEIPYNNIDDDCNSETLDDDLDNDGYLNFEDCDDENPDVNPGVIEIADNGIDDDCIDGDLTTSVNYELIPNWQIGPNPASTFIQVEIPNKSHFTISLFNVNGQSFFVNQTDNLIYTNDLPNGKYFIEVQDKITKEKSVKSIIIIH